MSYPNRGIERGLRARLAWVGCGMRRATDRSVTLRSAHAVLIARLMRRAQIAAGMPWNRLQVDWPVLTMELAAGLWPAPSASSKDDVSIGATTTIWKVIERAVSAHAGTTAAGTTAAGTTAAAEARATTAGSAVPSSSDSRARIERYASIAAPFAPARGAVRLASAPAFAVGQATRHTQSQNHDVYQADRAPTSMQPIELRMRPPTPSRAVPPRTSMQELRREVLPAFAAPPVSIPLREPSLIDHLFSSEQRPAALDGMTFRVLPASSPLPEPTPPAQPAGDWHEAQPQPAPASGIHTRFSRSEVDLLAARVMTLIKRQERLERESKGLL